MNSGLTTIELTSPSRVMTLLSCSNHGGSDDEWAARVGGAVAGGEAAGGEAAGGGGGGGGGSLVESVTFVAVGSECELRRDASSGALSFFKMRTSLFDNTTTREHKVAKVDKLAVETDADDGTLSLSISGCVPDDEHCAKDLTLGGVNADDMARLFAFGRKAGVLCVAPEDDEDGTSFTFVDGMGDTKRLVLLPTREVQCYDGETLKVTAVDRVETLPGSGLSVSGTRPGDASGRPMCLMFLMDAAASAAVLAFWDRCRAAGGGGKPAGEAGVGAVAAGAVAAEAGGAVAAGVACGVAAAADGVSRMDIQPAGAAPVDISDESGSAAVAMTVATVVATLNFKVQTGFGDGRRTLTRDAAGVIDLYVRDAATGEHKIAKVSELKEVAGLGPMLMGDRPGVPGSASVGVKLSPAEKKKVVAFIKEAAKERARLSKLSATRAAGARLYSGWLKKVGGRSILARSYRRFFVLEAAAAASGSPALVYYTSDACAEEKGALQLAGLVGQATPLNQLETGLTWIPQGPGGLNVFIGLHSTRLTPSTAGLSQPSVAMLPRDVSRRTESQTESRPAGLRFGRVKKGDPADFSFWLQPKASEKTYTLDPGTRSDYLAWVAAIFGALVPEVRPQPRIWSPVGAFTPLLFFWLAGARESSPPTEARVSFW